MEIHAAREVDPRRFVQWQLTGTSDAAADVTVPWFFGDEVQMPAVGWIHLCRAAAGVVLLWRLGVAPAAAATTFVVNSAADALGTNVGNGICETAAGTQICTLRRALAEADALLPDAPGQPPGDVTIVLAPGTITLNAASPRLRVAGAGALTVLGAGIDATIIEASTASAFELLVTSARLSGFTLQHAAEPLTGSGTLALEHVAVRDSQRGIIWSGDARMSGVDVRNNGVTTAEGGGLLITGSAPTWYHVRIRQSTFHGNRGSLGGAIRMRMGLLVLENVSLSSNQAVSGGALALAAFAGLRSTNATFISNTASDSGGGIFFGGRDTNDGLLPLAGTAVLAHNTLTANQSDVDRNGFGRGPGIAVWVDGRTGIAADVAITHSIVMGNEKTAFIGGVFFPAPGDCDGPIVATGPNMFGVVDCTIDGPAPMVADAFFLAFTVSNGGWTPTTSPGIFSPTVNAGNPAPCLDAFGLPLTRDQRNHVLPAAGTNCDLGAVERGSVPALLARPYDLSGDRKADLVWRYRPTGQNALWTMNGGAIASPAFLTTVPTVDYTIVGSGDFDGDGRADLLWRLPGLARNAVWLMDGSTIREGAMLPDLPDLAPYEWRVAGLGDLDGDARADIVWERMRRDVNGLESTGDLTVWLMDGGAVRGVRPLSHAGWLLAGVADANQDGTADLLWREVGGSGTELWLMANAASTAVVTLPGRSADWTVAAFVDLDGDNRADAVWRNDAGGGLTSVWLMTGISALADSGTLPTVAPEQWSLVHVVDTDGDNKADVIWRSGYGGQNARWRMDGKLILAAEFLTAVPDPNWEIK